MLNSRYMFLSLTFHTIIMALKYNQMWNTCSPHLCAVTWISFPQGDVRSASPTELAIVCTCVLGGLELQIPFVALFVCLWKIKSSLRLWHSGETELIWLESESHFDDVINPYKTKLVIRTFKYSVHPSNKTKTVLPNYKDQLVNAV
jgi:hypothetical protein